MVGIAMPGRRRAAGFSVLEATISLGVLALVGGTIVWGGPAQLRATAAGFRASSAHRLATGALEAAGAHARELETGTLVLSVPESAPLADAHLVRVVTERRPGLLEVEAIVRWSEPGEATPRETRVVTLVARETDR